MGYPLKEEKMEITDLVVGGVSLGGFIILAVQALKQLPFVNDENVAYLPWGVGFVFLALYAVQAAYPPSAPFIAEALKAIAGTMAAVLGYVYGLKPAVQNLAAKLTISDLEE